MWQSLVCCKDLRIFLKPPPQLPALPLDFISSTPSSCCSCLWTTRVTKAKSEEDLPVPLFLVFIWIVILQSSKKQNCSWSQWLCLKQGICTHSPKDMFCFKRGNILALTAADGSIRYSSHAWQPFPLSWTNPPAVFPWERFFWDLSGGFIKCFLSGEKTGTVCKSIHHTLQVNLVS